MRPHIFITLLTISLVSSQSFYITFHGGKGGFGNVGVYSLNGEKLGNLLSSESGHNSLRGLAYNYTDGTVFIASAKDDTIITTHGCKNGINIYSDSFDLDHPYGIDLDTALGRVYVSNQNGDNVICFNARGSGTVSVFAEVSNPRGLAVDRATSDVYVSSEDDSAVFGFDKNGNRIRKYEVDIPIGVYIDSGVLYISNRGNNPGVYSYNITTGLQLRTYPTEDSHPTGIVYYKGILYVLGQTNQKLYHYDAVTGSSLGSLATFTDDYPEQIILGTCEEF